MALKGLSGIYSIKCLISGAIAFDRWLVCYEFMRKGNHLTDDGAPFGELKSIANHINKFPFNAPATKPLPSMDDLNHYIENIMLQLCVRSWDSEQ